MAELFCASFDIIYNGEREMGWEMMSFTHLQVKTGYSLMKSTITIDRLISKAKQLDFSALAITDEQVLYGVIPFYKACTANNIKPIIGMTVQIIADDKETENCILLAKTNHGYQQLVKLSTILQTKQKNGLEKNILKNNCSDLICILPFIHSKLSYMTTAASADRVKAYLDSWKQLFSPGDFYIGVEDYGGEQERQLQKKLRKHLRLNDVGAVAINDVSYLNEQDDIAFDCLQAIRRGVQWDMDRASVHVKRHHLRSKEEMAQLFSDWQEILDQSEEIAKKCNVHFSFDKRMLPSYPLPNNTNADDYLRELCVKNLKRKYDTVTEAIQQRLNYELEIITSMQFSDYFLIVWDFIKYAKDHNIMVGPGRGSSAGSLVAYVLNITEIDPIAHDLLFERFLNPERLTMPDIDVDFSDRRRDEVIAYVRDKYGAAHVAQIVTFGTFAARSIIRELIKTMSIDQQDSRFILKQMPQHTSKTLREILQITPDLASYVQQSAKLKQLFSLAIKLEGLPRHISTHAAGVVISEQPLTEHVPLTASSGNAYLTQFTMNDLESMGLLKIDFLGLRNLTLIENILQSIHQGTGQQISLKDINANDAKTYQLLRNGKTNGIFQLESDGMKRVLKRLKPSSFEDIVAVNALYRPGPMENIPIYIERKHGKQKVVYPHPDLEPILKPTYGVLIYQEQIMQIAHKIAGFSMGQADILRRAVSKKKKDVMREQKSYFIRGCQKNGYSTEIAEELFAWIVKFADYGFPKGHAVAYSKISYQLAYLKTHYPAYFYAELLSSVANQQDKLHMYVKEMKEFGIELLPPAINESFGRYTVENDKIRAGLLSIKGISNRTVQEIVQARAQKNFSSLFDFYLRISEKAINRSAIETLIMAGAFDELHTNRASLLASIDKAMEQADLFKEFADQPDLFATEFPIDESYVEMEDFTLLKKLADEKELLGMYVSSHPLKNYRGLLKANGFLTLNNAINHIGDKNAKGVVIVQDIKKIRTKRGESMAFLKIADETDELDAVIFPNLYREHGFWLKEGSAIQIFGKIERRNGQLQWVIYQLETFSADKLQISSSTAITIKVVQHNGKETLSFLKNLMQRYPGKHAIMLLHSDHAYRLNNYFIQPEKDCLDELKGFFGEENISFWMG
ncbi:DNA polymerase III subunit alpha [Virgibacillus sp. 179-BFC.A HS]|uniref:DNA polymerase III subunit alpha n=1 Tax=Tigheibacillus jepli TaxID=3035914 RepID=A0ABU5CGD7_9BACI|nr:DNA polymerase III subunit alpha [Virgibacillus sp. 179-BFC.A HS]MDY0405346.1 DNA polymerase III subunit alpha [Virgibacillus sp. 179-BFC.A HS]